VRCGRLPWQGPAEKIPRVGVVGGGSTAAAPASIEAFLEGLRERGYVDGQNIVIDVRPSTGGRDTREILDELVQLPVDVIVTSNTSSARRARDRTAVIPIVMARSGVDPVVAGLATSLSHPGGNVTGLTASTQELSGKRLELLRESLPHMARVAALWTVSVPEKEIEIREVQVAAQTLGVDVQPLGIRTPADVDLAVEAAARSHADALIALEDGSILAQAPRIVELAIQNRLPMISEGRAWAEIGGLMAYGVSLPEMFQRAAAYVDKILKGARPGDLPVERPMRFEFTVNLRTAQALGLTLPRHVLLQATELI
jgi:putative ABC transport system substrate-binding protein